MTGAARLDVEVRVDRRDCRGLGREDAVTTDAGQKSTRLEDVHDRRLEIGEVKRAAALALMFCFTNEKLASCGVDEVDATADEQHVRLLGMTAAHRVELLVHVIDGAEEERPVDAQQSKLRTFGSVRFDHGFEPP